MVEKRDAGRDHRLATVASCSLIGSLILSGTLMGLFLRYRRRRAGTAVKYLEADDSSVSTIAQPLFHSQCSWCYISETGMCKWCSGEAEDIVDDGDSEWNRGGGGNLFIDYQQNGWRSVINLPDISPGGSLKRENSTSPSRGSRSPGAATRGARATLANSTTTTTTTVPKRSFRGDGIYQVQRPRNMPEPPRKAKSRPWRELTLE